MHFQRHEPAARPPRPEGPLPLAIHTLIAHSFFSVCLRPPLILDIGARARAPNGTLGQKRRVIEMLCGRSCAGAALHAKVNFPLRDATFVTISRG